MTKKKTCPACLAQEKGIRSRVPFRHTCGLEPAAVKKVEDEPIALTFAEIKESTLNDPRLSLRDKLELMKTETQNEFYERLVDLLKIQK